MSNFWTSQKSFLIYKDIYNVQFPPFTPGCEQQIHPGGRPKFCSFLFLLLFAFIADKELMAWNLSEMHAAPATQEECATFHINIYIIIFEE